MTPALPRDSEPATDYYDSMLITAIIAGMAIFALIVVVGLYLKRTTTYKAIISGDGNRKKATFANRAFKVIVIPFIHHDDYNKTTNFLSL